MELPRFIFQAREILVEKPWGGNWIAMLKGFRQSGIGESWEFSAHPSNPSEVLIKGEVISLSELFTKAKEELLGSLADKYTSFPILVKLLDVNSRISVQVHPSDKVAATLGEEDPGKDEAWLMLNSGIIYAGFKRDVEFTEIEQIVASEKEKIFELLNKYEAKPNDTFIIGAGIVHCIEKAKILEVSTNSNLTYRICDFAGRGENLDKAKKALNLHKSHDYEIRGKRGKIETEKFCVEVLDVKEELEFNIDAFNIVFSADGFAILKSQDEIADLQKGYSCLVPAKTKSFTVQSENAKIIRIWPV